MKPTLALAASLALGAAAFAGDHAKKAVAPTPEDHWKFQLSLPGWIPNLEGDIGINGIVSPIGVDANDLIPRIDMVASLRAEASKGRFGITSDFIYMSLSDGVGTNSVVKKVDLQVDQTFTANLVVLLRWHDPALAHAGPGAKRFALDDI